MIITTLHHSCDLNSGVSPSPLKNAFITGDQEAHRFEVSCHRGIHRKDVDLSKATIVAHFIRADKSTVYITGEVVNNAAVVTLPAACYTYPGRFSLVIRAVLDHVKHTIFWGEGSMSLGSTETLIDPGHTIPDLTDLLAQIDAMEAATQDADDAATSAVQAAKAANEAAASADAAVQAGLEQMANVLNSKANAIECEASGPVVSVTDAAAQPAVRLISHLAPVQAAEGGAITGHTAVTLRQVNKNFVRLNNVNNTTSGVSFSASADNTILTVSGVSEGTAGVTIAKKLTLPPGTYTASYRIISGNFEATLQSMSLFLLQVSGQNEIRLRASADTVKFTVEETWSDASFRFITGGEGTKYNDLVLSVQIERGEQVTEHVTGAATTLTANLPETVYGGSLDWYSGVVTSEMDAEGNALAEPKTLLIEPQQLSLLKGVNHVWCDTGDVALAYAADTKLYIDKKFDELTNALLSTGSNV